MAAGQGSNAPDTPDTPDMSDTTNTPEESDTSGYGEGWESLRRQTLRRDGYACQRCGDGGRVLQAHHVVPRSAGGPDRLENLLTLCRPCHGVMHQRNRSFDDVRDEASLFPTSDAPSAVSVMREPNDHVCARCGRERDDPAELVAYTGPTARDGSVDDSDHLILCKPCAGLCCARDGIVSRESLEGNHRFTRHELVSRREDAPVRSSVFAPPVVAIRRPPRTRRERVIDDTPLRFLFAGRTARWVVLVVVGYVLLMVLLAVL